MTFAVDWAFKTNYLSIYISTQYLITIMMISYTALCLTGAHSALQGRPIHLTLLQTQYATADQNKKRQKITTYQQTHQRPNKVFIMNIRNSTILYILY